MLSEGQNVNLNSILEQLAVLKNSIGTLGCFAQIRYSSAQIKTNGNYIFFMI